MDRYTHIPPKLSLPMLSNNNSNNITIKVKVYPLYTNSN